MFLYFTMLTSLYRAGVGQVVLQVAAEARCAESYGIEKQDNPSQYAVVCIDTWHIRFFYLRTRSQLMEQSFLDRCKYFGVHHGPVCIMFCQCVDHIISFLNGDDRNIRRGTLVDPSNSLNHSRRFHWFKVTFSIPISKKRLRMPTSSSSTTMLLVPTSIRSLRYCIITYC